MQLFTIKQHKLKNGVIVLYCHTPNSVAFELSIHIDSGVRDENQENNGVSHFLEHMMFRGSDRYPNSILLAQALESLGGEVNAMTGIENTSYWIKGDALKTLDGIERFSNFFLHPVYSDLEIERRVILQEMASDYNDEDLCIDSETLAMSVLFANHPLGLPIIGTKNTVEKLSAFDLEEKRRNFYLPEKTIITIHSSEPEEEVIKKIKSCFTQAWNHNKNSNYLRMPADQIIPNFQQIKKPQNALFLQNNQDNQYAVKIMFPTVGGLSSKVVYATFLQRFLDDGICTRLPANIREKFGLVYDISCDTQYFLEIGTFTIDITVSENLIDDLIEKLSLEFKKIISEKSSIEEIDHIKFRYIFDLKQIKETPSRLLHREAIRLFMGNQFSIDDEMTSVQSMTPDLLLFTAQQIFGAARRSFVLVGPKARKKRDLIEKFLAIFNLIKEH